MIYNVNRLSRCPDAPSVPALQGIKQLILYLLGCPHCPIMYPYGLNRNYRHGVFQEVSPEDFHTQHTSRGLVAFVDGVEGQTANGNTVFNVSYCDYLVSWSTGQIKFKQPLPHTQLTQRCAPSILPKKCAMDLPHPPKHQLYGLRCPNHHLRGQST